MERYRAAALLAQLWEENLRLGPDGAYLRGMHLLWLKNIIHGGDLDRWPGKRRSNKKKTLHSIKKSASAVVFAVPQTELHFCIYAK